MNLKELRLRINLTQKQLAEQMETTQQTVARWETGKTTLNVDQIRDLCMVLQCTAEELLGWETDANDVRISPFSVVSSELPYGTLQIKTAGSDREYPVSEEARKSLLTQIDAFGPLNDGSASAWLFAWTLNNKLLLINPAHLMKFRLISDDVEAMPSFENAEVYRALEDWPNITVTGKIRRVCDALAARLGSKEEVYRLVSEVCITYADGSPEWSNLSEETATAWHGAMMGVESLGQSSFTQIQEEGYYDATFANLGFVALVEIPANLYFRLTTD
ncbi:helix-turn-helix transcriptional regulator [Sulfitobacter sp. 1A15333]|uniref:helix-turn-helix transcriptional regulator n=1 Tax=Sulfitobacter sp. 1A15333 TaxID=3368570 RepID=UPI003745F961